jgi:hypothetical protein
VNTEARPRNCDRWTGHVLLAKGNISRSLGRDSWEELRIYCNSNLELTGLLRFIHGRLSFAQCRGDNSRVAELHTCQPRIGDEWKDDANLTVKSRLRHASSCSARGHQGWNIDTELVLQHDRGPTDVC